MECLYKVTGNFPSKYRRRGKSLACQLCSGNLAGASGEGEGEGGSSLPLHSQSHIFTCEGLRDLRDECEPTDDNSLAEFFKKVVARNMDIEGFC